MTSIDIEKLKTTFPESVTLFQSVYGKRAKQIPLWKWLEATMQPAGGNELTAKYLAEQSKVNGSTVNTPCKLCEQRG